MQQVSCLVAILISHRHADHLVGLPGLLLARRPSDPPLLVLLLAQDAPLHASCVLEIICPQAAPE